jgi:hypothetical protein
MAERKDKFITMRITTKLHSDLKKLAVKDHRTLTNQISLILLQAVERDGAVKR